MTQDKAADLDEVKEFYDPHPGFMGAAAPIPEPVRLAAAALAGQKLSLRQAVAMIQAATSGQVQVDAKHQFISLRLIGNGNHHCHFYRVIRYR